MLKKTTKEENNLKSLKLNIQVTRAAAVGKLNADGTLPVTFVTENPSLEYDLMGQPYYEILDLSEGSVDLSKLREPDNRVTFIESHIIKPMIILGSVKDIEILHTATPRKGVGNIEFSETQTGQDAKKNFLSGHREYVSVGGERIMPPISVMQDAETGLPIVRLKWKLIDVSGVHEPADEDARVKINRSASEGDDYLEIPLNITREESTMKLTPEQIAAKEAELNAKEKELALKEEVIRSAQPQPPPTANISVGDDKLRDKIARDKALDDLMVLAIDAVGLEFGDVQKEIQRMKAENIDPSNFRAWMVKKKAEKAASSPDENHLGLTNKEQVKFSIHRALKAMHMGTFNEGNKEIGFELEVSRAAEAAQPNCIESGGRNALTLPPDITHSYARMEAITPNDLYVAEQVLKKFGREMSVDQSTKGGAWTAPGLTRTRFIDVLTAATITDKINITQIPGLTGEFEMGVLDAIQTAYFRGEHEDATLSDLTTSTRKMSPRLISAGTKMSYLLTIMAGGMGIEMLAEQKLALALAIKRNQGFLYGTGTNKEVLGILVNSGVNLIAGGANGAAPTVDNYIKMRTAVAAANAGSLPGQPSVFLLNSVTIGKNQRTPIESGDPARVQPINTPLGSEAPPLIGHRVVESNLLRSNLTKGSGTDLSEAVFLNPAEVYEGTWGSPRILIDDKTGAAADKKITYIHEYKDYMLGHAVAVSIMNDLITT